MPSALIPRFFEAVAALDVATARALLAQEPTLAQARQHGHSPLVEVYEHTPADDSASWAPQVAMEALLLNHGAPVLREVNRHQRLLFNANIRPDEQRKGWLLGNIVEECFKRTQEGAPLLLQSQRLRHWLEAIPAAQRTFGLTTVMTAWVKHIQVLQKEGNFDQQAQQLSDHLLGVVCAFEPLPSVFDSVTEGSALHERVLAYQRARHTLSDTPHRSRRQRRS